MKNILVAGSLNMDLVIMADRMPHMGKTVNEAFRNSETPLLLEEVEKYGYTRMQCFISILAE